MRIKLDEGAFAPMRAHNFIDLTGRRYGYLDVLQRVEDKVLSSGRKNRNICASAIVVIQQSLLEKALETAAQRVADAIAEIH